MPTMRAQRISQKTYSTSTVYSKKSKMVGIAHPTKLSADMSIAISVVLRPSKILRYCTISFSLLLLSIGVYIGSLEHLSLLERSAFITVCIFAAWRSFIYAQRHAKTQWHLNIDGKGQLRCQLDNSAESRPFKLLTGTTLWAQALFLRLHNPEDNLQMNLAILPDALSEDEFRRLLVACKWIVARA